MSTKAYRSRTEEALKKTAISEQGDSAQKLPGQAVQALPGELLAQAFPMPKTVRSGRRSLCLEINAAGELILRAPWGAGEKEIEAFLERHRGWILRHREKIRCEGNGGPTLEELRREAKVYIPGRVEFYSRQMGLVPASAKITSAKRSYGSCSGKNALCFSLYLMRSPKEAVDYVVVHELAHIRYKNHGAAFYRLIGSVLPDYPARRALLGGKEENK